MKKAKQENFIVFFDFDNTITTIDVIDDMLERFSGDDKWKDLEEKWRREEIGSRECLKGQVESIKVGRERLDSYLSTVKIDPYFKKLLGFFGSRKIPVLIVSDNFDYMLNGILERNGITGMEVYCNKVDIAGERFSPSFPYSNSDCGDCANCKKTHLLKKRKDGMKAVYIGDGKSDVCASKVSDLVFAKGYLKDLFKEEGLPHVAIDGLKDVYDYFERILA
ncbi:MAG: MtnX-like HAD-IB family phosphatase [Candidatus Omnitrophica bacterium]|nr:MtnX-like HAD-IB family phosphatase [Candidatus Omnitrophota bacterium]